MRIPIEPLILQCVSFNETMVRGIFKALGVVAALLVGGLGEGAALCAEACAPPEYPKGERLYPLVTGISCWVGDDNDIWLGDRVVQVRMRFRDDAQAEAFADQRYEVGGTPSALNNMHAYNAAPCMYAVGELTPPDATEMRREGKGARPLLHIKHWVTVVPYLCNRNDALVDWMPPEVEIKAHIISGALPHSAYIRHEYKIAEYSSEELADEQMHRGLYPVVRMEAGTKKATVVLARMVADTFTCPVQFTDKEQAESFFTAEHCAEVEQARQAGLPPVLYFIGRYDREQKVFLAERWMQAADIASDIEQLGKLPLSSPSAHAPSRGGWRALEPYSSARGMPRVRKPAKSGQAWLPSWQRRWGFSALFSYRVLTSIDLKL